MKKLIECCERCERPKIDTKCDVCKRKICFSCSASIHYEYHITVCYDCHLREDFNKIYKKYDKKYWNTHKKITVELGKLPKKPPKNK